MYDATWGRKKSVTFPTPGDHEYHSGTPPGTYTYFGVPPYYSFDIGAWHWVSLNSEIDHAATSAQVQWLRQDLAATRQPCIGAFWSVPAFSSGKGNDPSYRPFWDALYGVRADLVLAGDSHQYERFTKMAPDGTPAGDGDPAVRGRYRRPEPARLLRHQADERGPCRGVRRPAVAAGGGRLRLALPDRIGRSLLRLG